MQIMPNLELSPTVYGIETEYTCSVTYPGNEAGEIVGKCHSVDVELELFSEPAEGPMDKMNIGQYIGALDEMGIKANHKGMLSNGGKFYNDVSGPEYCTPEFKTAEEAVHGTFDGDRIVIGFFETLRKSGQIDSYQLNRRIVDHNRTSRGVHINTTTDLGNDQLAIYARQIATLNIVKGAMFGSGGLLLDAKGRTEFHHSPRLSITDTFFSKKFSERPLMRLPAKDDGPYMRLETITGDALNFAWPLRASLVLTNAVTQMLELGYEYTRLLPVLRKPVKAAHTVGRFGNGHDVSICGNNGYVALRPSEIISYICSIILHADSKEGHLDDESKQVLAEVVDVADRIVEDPLSVASQVESIARWMAISRKMEKSKVDLDSEKICRFDFYWDWLNGGIAERLRESNKAGWQGFTEPYSRSTTVKRMHKPPQDTRAKIRGDLINAGDPEKLVKDWHHIGSTTVVRDAYVHPLQTEL